jgi:hypothetical protein
MNDAHVYEMQMQLWKPNTWGVATNVSSLKPEYKTLQQNPLRNV